MILRSANAGGRHGDGRAPARRPLRWLAPTGVVAIFAGLLLLSPPALRAGGAEALPAPRAVQGFDSGVNRDILNDPASVALIPPPPPPDGPVEGVDFDLIVPSLGYRRTVLEGTGKEILDQAPGHYVTTAWPGTVGNVGVAAHNTYWLNAGFDRLKVGDRVEIQGRRGLYEYEISDIKVVNPDDRTVLAPTGDRRLTLTTCYPLWAGAWATQRLIFTAFEIGAVSGA